MLHVCTRLEASLKFGARTAIGFAASPCAAFRRWKVRASPAAIAHSLSDRHLNPFLFQIEAEDNAPPADGHQSSTWS